ncbi:MAG: Calx-beta domain-containing protein, partial [Cyanobacteriota bacterium]|nr:Calx-beta domain-containing protein [Cyanobacteriota bacterium]
PIVNLSVDLTTAEEANTTAVTVTVTTSAIVDGEQTVNLDISGLGITPTDYALSSPQIGIPDGENTASVTFQVLDDGVFEGDEIATLSLSNPSEGIVLANATANITLIDDDIPATVEFSQADYQVNEDGSIVGTAITLSRTGDTSSSTTINVELSSETATAGIDFENLENGIVPIQFAANQSSIVLEIPILEDNLVEDNETFSLALVNPSPGSEVGSQNTATVEILDNETPRIEISPTDLSITESGIVDSYTLVLTTVPTEPVTIQFETDSQIQPLAEISFDENNWNTPQTVEVQAVDDELVEDRTHSSLIRHTVTSDDPNYNGFILSDVDIEIAENDVVDVSIAPTNIEVSEAGDTDTYSLVLTRQPELPVTIEFGVEPQQINPISPITFDANDWDIPQTVTVSAIDDILTEGDETLAISHTILSEDPDYRDLSLRNINVEIFDNDVNAEILINIENVSVTEGEITASYEIVLSSPPTLPVIIEFETGDRINPIPSLEFNDTNWNTPQTVTVVATDDSIRQGNSTEIISHQVISNDQNYADLEISDVSVNVTDNDTATVRITQTASRTEVTEDGLTDTYTVNLTSQPSDNVTVTITPDSQVDLGEGVETEIELIFTPENWNQTQTVTVTAIDDDAVEADIHTSTINHRVSSNDPDYNNQSVIEIDNRTEENLTVDIVDNDEPLPPGEPGVSLLQPVRRTDVMEGFGNDIYKVVLNSEPIANVEITINSGSQLQSDQSTLTFTPTNWNIPQTITLTAVDDDFFEEFQSVEISHRISSTDSRYNNLEIDSMAVNINDNDNIGEQIIFSTASIVSLSEADDRGTGSLFNDILFGNQGQDRLSGEEGLDLLYGQGGADGISGEVGNDVLFGGQGADQIQGDSGNDIIYGDRDSDRLRGGDGNDQLLGGFGDDRLSGDLGADTLTGGFGIDAFVIGFGTGGNTLENADVIIDFTPTQDRIELVSPLTFAQLSIVSIPDGTAIQVQSTGEFLAVLPGFDSTLLTEQDFV